MRKTIVVALAIYLATSPVSAQVRTAPTVARAATMARSAAPKPTMPSMKAPLTGTSAAGSLTHGNSRASTKPNVGYAIARTNTATGKTSVHKFGISSTGTKPGVSAPSRTTANRAATQVRKLNSAAAQNGQPYRYSTRTMKTFGDRSSALAWERQAVTKHQLKRNGASPPGNQRPTAAPYSPLKSK